MNRVVQKTEAIAESVYDLAMHVKAKAIVGATESGFTAREIAHERPRSAHLLMLTPKIKTLRQINLIWGVQAYLIPEVKSFEDLMKTMFRVVKAKKLAKKGDKVVVVTGEPLGLKENLNLVEVRTV